MLWLGPEVMLVSLVVALILDLIYPRHSGFLLCVHPVRTCYFMALRLHRPYSGRLWGAFVWLTCLITHLIPWVTTYWVLSYLSGLPRLLGEVAVTSVLLKFSFSIKLLLDHGRGVASCLRVGREDCAREYAQGIVRRDLSGLGKAHVCSATIESLAEGYVDGFLAPLLYYVTLGPLAAFAQRLVNTLDGALGYKDPEFREEGFISALADDVINFIPARLSAMFIATSSFTLGYGFWSAVDSWIKYSRTTESPNAGHPMSAIAGSLGVWLEKPGHYILNPEGREPNAEDVGRAVKVVVIASLLFVLTLLTLLSTLTLARII